MAASTFIAGYSGNVIVNPGSPVTLDVTEWNAQRTINVLDATHSGSNAAFIPVKGAPFKVVANIKANHDSAKLPLSFKEGDYVTATLKHGTTAKTLVVEGLVASMNDTNSVAGFCSYDFTVEGFVSSYVS